MATIPAALAAINTLLMRGDGASPQAYETIANVSSINGLNLSANVVDVTSHSTGRPWRQKISTLKDAGELTADVFFIPGASNHQQLLDDFTAVPATISDWRIQFPDEEDTTWQCEGFVSKLSFKEPVDGVVTASLTITFTGEPDFEVTP